MYSPLHRLGRIALAVLFTAGLFITPVAAFAAPITPTPTSALAQVAKTATVPDEYMRAEVTSIVSETPSPTDPSKILQIVTVHIQSGKDAGKTETIHYDLGASEAKIPMLHSGESVVVIKIQDPDGVAYYVSDINRIPALLAFVGLFLLLAIVIGRGRGMSSVVGLGASIAILVFAVVPAIVHGNDPRLVILLASPFIIGISMFLAHGFSRQTGLAVISTVLTLILAALLAGASVSIANLYGGGNEEALYVNSLLPGGIDLQGILLVGIIIGAIGVLNDITTAQTATAHEIKEAKPEIKFAELFTRSMRVGREHIASLVNTLVLAYAGVAFPLFLLLYITHGEQPLWTVISSQQISEEIVRTFVGSCALILSVPISSALATWFYTRNRHNT